MHNLTVAWVASYLVGAGQWVLHNQDVALEQFRLRNPDGIDGRFLLQLFAETVEA